MAITIIIIEEHCLPVFLLEMAFFYCFIPKLLMLKTVKLMMILIIVIVVDGCYLHSFLMSLFRSFCKVPVFL